MKKADYPWILVLFFLSVIFCLPLLKHLYHSCSGDWDYFVTVYDIPLVSILEYKQFPLWNPYCCGGMSYIGNPQNGFLSITFFITLVFGTVPGLKISIWLHTFIGLWGMWLLCGYFKLNRLERVLPCLIFMFSSSWSLHLAAGHITWLPAAYIPLVLLFLLKSIDNNIYVILAAGVESLMILGGATYILGFSVLFLFIYSVCLAVEKKNIKILIHFFLVNIIAACLAGFKMFPLLELLFQNPRIAGVGGMIDIVNYIKLLLLRHLSLYNPLYDEAWWELGSYIGIPVLVIYFYSFKYFNKYRPLFVTSIVFFLLGMGNFIPLSPWAMIHKIPLYSSYTVPTRSFILYCFSVALIVGVFSKNISIRYKKHCNLIMSTLIIVVFIDLFSISAPIIKHSLKPFPYWLNGKTYILPKDKILKIGQHVPSFHNEFVQTSIPIHLRNKHGSWSNQYPSLLENNGVVDAYETIPIKRNAFAINDNNYSGEYFFIKSSSVNLIQWSPNKIQLSIKVETNDTLVINQNFSRGWRVTKGKLLQYKGLISAKLPPGSYTVTFFYKPISFIIGAILSLMMFTGCCIYVGFLTMKRYGITFYLAVDKSAY